MKHSVLRPLALVGASFLVEAIVMGFISCSGLYYISFINSGMDYSTAILSFTASLNRGVVSGFGPIASLIVNRFGCERATIGGGFVASVGLFLASFTDNIYLLQVTLGVLAGTGGSTAFLAAVVIIGNSSITHRKVATTLANAGVGLGYTIFPWLVDSLISEYGWRGSFLILAGIFSQIIVCGFLFKITNTKNCNMDRKASATNKDMSKTESNVYSSFSFIHFTDSKNNISSKKNKHENGFKLGEYSSNSEHLNNTTNVSVRSENDFHEDKHDSIQLQKNPVHKGKLNSILQPFKLYVFVNYGFIAWLISNVFRMFSISIFFVHIGAFFLQITARSDIVAFFFCTIGVVNFLGRLLLGLVVQYVPLSSITVFIIYVIGEGLCIALISFSGDFPQEYNVVVLFFSCAVLYGFFGSSYTLWANITTEILGVEDLSTGLGYSQVFCCFGTISGAAVAGKLKEVIGSYPGAFQLSASCAIASALLMLVSWIKLRNSRPKENNENL